MYDLMLGHQIIVMLGSDSNMFIRLDSPTSGVLPIILARDGSRVARCFQAMNSIG